MSNFNKNLENIIRNDKLNFGPDSGIQNRLNTALNYKFINSKAKQNSFGSLFIGLFTPNNLGLKIATLSVLALFFFNIPKFSNQNKNLMHCDSLNQMVSFEDTLIFKNAVDIDSIMD